MLLLCRLLFFVYNPHSNIAVRVFSMPKKVKNNGVTTEYACHRCGVGLTPENSREVATEYSVTGISHLCIDCEQKYFDELASVEGRSLALFHCCAAFNVPCKPIVLADTDFESNEASWILYIDCLAEAGEDRKDDEVLTFFDGETDLLRVFGRNFTEKDLAAYIKNERAKLDRIAGTAEQRTRWGEREEGEAKEATEKRYAELDRLYAARASAYSGQTITPQMKITLIKVAKWDFEIDRLIQRGKYTDAKALQTMVDNVLSSEQMRKKDEKPVEGYELMSQVFTLERAGLMEDGKFLPIDKLQEVLFKRFIKGKKYDYSIDVCDAVIERVWSTMRANADAYMPDELPSDLDIEDKFDEFADEETDEEREHKRFTNTTNISFEKPKKATKKSVAPNTEV